MKPRKYNFDKIIQMIEDDYPLKEIAYLLKIPYSQVTYVSTHYFKEVRKRVRNSFNPLQLDLF